MLREAQKLQAKLMEELRKIRIEGSAGGGMVRIEMDGEQNVLAVKIEPEVFKKKMLQWLKTLYLLP